MNGVTTVRFMTNTEMHVFYTGKFTENICISSQMFSKLFIITAIIWDVKVEWPRKGKNIQQRIKHKTAEILSCVFSYNQWKYTVFNFSSEMYQYLFITARWKLLHNMTTDREVIVPAIVSVTICVVV